MLLTIDPTNTGFLVQTPETRSELANSLELITYLKKLKIDSTTILQVVRGPGHFTNLRIAALVANTLATLTNCQLQTKKCKEKKFQIVPVIQPFYGQALGFSSQKACAKK